jgi:hypothetical protein
LLAERGITVSYETVRRWVNHFGPMIAANLRKRRPKPYTTWHLDESLSENLERGFFPSGTSARRSHFLGLIPGLTGRLYFRKDKR